MHLRCLFLYQLDGRGGRLEETDSNTTARSKDDQTAWRQTQAAPNLGCPCFV